MTQQGSADSTPDSKHELLQEIETAIERYRHLGKRNSVIQWSALLPVTVAGFFTTAAGGVGMENAWYASPSALTIWGLIAVIGSLIIQTANPGQIAERCEQKKDAMRAIRTALKFRALDLAVAAELVELARDDPRQALDYLSKQKTI